MPEVETNRLNSCPIVCEEYMCATGFFCSITTTVRAVTARPPTVSCETSGAEPCEIDDDLEPAIVGAHECEECGTPFDTPHGLAVYEGRAHDDSGKTDVDANETDEDTQRVAADGGKQRVPREIIGGHGIAETEVTHHNDFKKDQVLIDLSPWVDADGFGRSATGRMVKKKFQQTVILMVDREWDDETECNRASAVYVGEKYRRKAEQTYAAHFEADVPKGSYYATFTVKDKSEVLAALNDVDSPQATSDGD